MEDIILEFENELIKYSYEKIWSELSEKDKVIIRGVVKFAGEEKISRKCLMERLEIKSEIMNRYQLRLKEKGLLVSPGYGFYQLALPRFSNFVSDYHMED